MKFSIHKVANYICYVCSGGHINTDYTLLKHKLLLGGMGTFRYQLRYILCHHYIIPAD